MKTITMTYIIRFTRKGQFVVPCWLRKELDNKKGTRALVLQKGGCNRAEGDHAQAHQESSRFFERLGRAEIADGGPQARTRTELKSIRL